MQAKRIILAGGTGFLGRVLAERFREQSDEPVILTRTPRNDGPVREVAWDGRTPGEWRREIDGADAIINLAGRTVDGRYHARNRRLILDSRVESTRVLGEAIGRCAKPPRDG